jgi:hypothetical protein
MGARLAAGMLQGMSLLAWTLDLLGLSAGSALTVLKRPMGDGGRPHKADFCDKLRGNDVRGGFGRVYST